MLHVGEFAIGDCHSMVAESKLPSGAGKGLREGRDEGLRSLTLYKLLQIKCCTPKA